jgi:ABC-2 type transport system permease protein
MPIFDQGYQHWSGTLSGHAWRWLAITRHGVRIGMKGMFLRIALLIAWLPAIVLAFMLCLWGLLEQKSNLVTPIVDFLVTIKLIDAQIAADPRHYRVEIWTLCYDYFLLMELRFSMILILMIGPNLISQDLRFNALPLYFSRPLRRIDYFAGKLGVIAVFLGMVVILPSLIAYVLGLLFSLDITIVRDTFPLLLSVIVYGLLISLSAGLLILALSSLSRNSRYIALFWLAIWFVSSIVGVVLEGVDQGQRHAAHYRKNMARQNAQPAHPPQGAVAPANEPRGGGQQDWQKDWEDFQAEEFEASKTNWRPLVSYTANLSRIGQQLLGTNTCWEKLSELRPPNDRARFMHENAGAQYPWYWSAAVLAGLFGLSVCILNFRVKSMDRLR